MNKLHIVNIAVKGDKQLTEEARKIIDNFKYLNTKLNSVDETLELIDVISVEDSVLLVPTKAYYEITYDTDKTFTITAVSTDIDGEDIQVLFVDPEDVSQSLAVSYDTETNIITVSHATDETGAINTSSDALETLINEDETVGVIIQSLGEADATIDFTGAVQLANYSYAKVCKKGKMFSDGNFIYLALADTDGITNETTDFKKIALSTI